MNTHLLKKLAGGSEPPTPSASLTPERYETAPRAARVDSHEPDFADLSARTYRLCLALAGHRADAEDAAQEALSRAWAYRGRKRSAVSWWTWVGGFAVRVVRERARKRAKLWAGEPEAAGGNAPQNLAGPPADPEHGELHRAVTALPRRQREVVVLRFLMGMSTAQTAAVLDAPEGTIKSNLHKALKGLGAKLERPETIRELRRG